MAKQEDPLVFPINLEETITDSLIILLMIHLELSSYLLVCFKTDEKNDFAGSILNSLSPNPTFTWLFLCNHLYCKSSLVLCMYSLLSSLPVSPRFVFVRTNHHPRSSKGLIVANASFRKIVLSPRHIYRQNEVPRRIAHPLPRQLPPIIYGHRGV